MTDDRDEGWEFVTETESDSRWSWPDAISSVAFWACVAFIAWLIAGHPGV